LQRVQSFENLDSHRFDRIIKTIEDNTIVVTGEKRVTEHAEGLGGNFTFCTLGDPMDLDRLLTGESLPTFDALGSVLFHMATSRATDTSRFAQDQLGFEGLGYLGDSDGRSLWLVYKPDLEFLKSPEAALSLAKAEALAAHDSDTHHLVFAPARFVSMKMLAEKNLRVEFAPLPYALYRIGLGA
jgi:adenine-specific DNA-methyltransferase